MSFESGKSDHSDTTSLAGSIDGSPTKKLKKKKKISIFRRKTKKESTRKVLSFDKDCDTLSLRSSVTETPDATPTDEEPLNAIARKIEIPASHTERRSYSLPTDAGHLLKENSLNRKSSPHVPDTHKLQVRLRSGEHLAARDSNGRSDPYAKFKIGGRTVYKSKIVKETLDPIWDEEFDIFLNLESNLVIRVYDKDRASRDDFMGAGKIDLSSLDETFTDVSIHLEDPDSDEELGYIHLELRLVSLLAVSEEQPKQREESTGSPIDTIPTSGATVVEKVKDTAKSRQESMKHSRTGSFPSRGHSPVAIATIQLVSGTDLPARDTNGLSDPYVKLCLGKTKRRKSKICTKTLNPVWKQEFTFYLTSAETSSLELSVFDHDKYKKDDFIGRCDLDLWSLKREETHSLNLSLTDTPGSLLLLVTIHEMDPEEKFLTSYDLNVLRVKYGLPSTFEDMKDVGFAEIRIISASGLASADMNGKSDPFCVVQLCNARAQTQTCYKTLDPVWNRVFNFPIRDIHDTFNITIFDQDQNFEKEFLGRIEIPILRSYNGDVKTYALKDRKLKERAKGTITLQINYIFNHVRAAIRTFNPRDEVFMEEIIKFKKNLLLQNFSRLWRIVQHLIATLEFVNSCFTWQNKTRSAIAFIMFLIIVWNFELYMLPVALLMLVLKNYVDIFIRKTRPPRHLMNADEAQRAGGDDDDEEEETSSSKSTGLLNRLRAIEEVLTKVQNILDHISSMGERLYNTVTWSVTYLGWLLVIVLIVLWIVLYFIPLRTLVILWGINKFTKRLRKPNYIPNNELMDYLSRMPSNIQLDEYRELPLSALSPNDSKKKR